ncbi:MAG: hypothetical protein FD146_2662, partial [Anaerolineaceae bacterium]
MDSGSHCHRHLNEYILKTQVK